MKKINQNKQIYLYEAEGRPRDGAGPTYSLIEKDESNLFWHIEPIHSCYDQIKRFYAYDSQEALMKIYNYLIELYKANDWHHMVFLENNQVIITHPNGNIAVMVIARKVEDGAEWIL